MSDNHHELCPKCGMYESDGMRCGHCGQLTGDNRISLGDGDCRCKGQTTRSVHEDSVNICHTCEGRLYWDSSQKPAPPSTVMLSSGIVLLVNEARLALEEINSIDCTAYSDPAEMDDQMERWLKKYFPASLDKPAAP